VVAVIGPVGRVETAAAVAVSRAIGLPHVVLASQLERERRPEGLPDPVVRVRTSPEELARAVARHAVLEVGLRRFAVLAPEEPEPQGVASPVARQVAAFRAEVERLGGSVARVVTYAPEARDFRVPVESLTPRVAPAPGSGMPPSAGSRAPARGAVRPDFDGLFIPDTAARVRRIVPYLEYVGLPLRTRPDRPGVQLLGTAGWHHASVIDRGTALTDNAIFADVWHDAADGEGHRGGAFSRRFEAAARSRPGPFHAEVFDAARLLALAVSGVSADAGVSARGLVLSRLLTRPPEAGVTGILAFSGGDPLPRVHLLTVHGETLRPRVSEPEEALLREVQPVGGESPRAPAP
jgi:ABC-type branched-subunit amino acid transport system substrate-binding protein